MLKLISYPVILDSGWESDQKLISVFLNSSVFILVKIKPECEDRISCACTHSVLATAGRASVWMLALSRLMLMFGDTLKTSSNLSSAAVWLRLCLLMHSDVTFDYKFWPFCNELAVSREFCNVATKAATFLFFPVRIYHWERFFFFFFFLKIHGLHLTPRKTSDLSWTQNNVRREKLMRILPVSCAVMLLVNSDLTISCSSYEWERD